MLLVRRHHRTCDLPCHPSGHVVDNLFCEDRFGNHASVTRPLHPPCRFRKTEILEPFKAQICSPVRQVKLCPDILKCNLQCLYRIDARTIPYRIIAKSFDLIVAPEAAFEPPRHAQAHNHSLLVFTRPRCKNSRACDFSEGFHYCSFLHGSGGISLPAKQAAYLSAA